MNLQDYFGRENVKLKKEIEHQKEIIRQLKDLVKSLEASKCVK